MLRYAIYFLASAFPLALCAQDSTSATAAAKPAATAGFAQITHVGFDTLSLGGTFQVQGFYHDMDDDNDQNKQLSLSVNEFRLDLNGVYNEHFGVLGQFLVQANAQQLGIENAYGFFHAGEWVFKAGKLAKPFSMEALQDDATLPTVQRGELYNNFLVNTTGYALYDVGATIQGGFVDAGNALTYEIGLFNGKQNNSPDSNYSGAQYVTQDAGFRAKDFAGRLAYKGLGGLEADLAFSTKTAEVLNGPGNLDVKGIAAYEAGLAYERQGLRFQGEIAWGDNQNGLDSNIVEADSSSEFLAFYAMLLWRHQYSHGRASEALVKMQGLDPTMSFSGSSKPNDGKFRYTLGANYFFTPKVSVLLDYGILQPITKVAGEGHLVYDLDALWRLNF